MTYGIVETVDTGRSITLCNVQWPITHQLHHAAHGWTVIADACGGDASIATRRHYASERLARAAFAELTGRTP